MLKKLLVIPLSILLLGCNSDDKDNSSDFVVQSGEAIYNKNCASCHEPNGQGLAEDWRIKDANGNYPVPHLNGTANTSHHTPAQQLYTINKGGTEMVGQMTAFEDLLSETEKQALIDYMYNLWPNEIQTRYDERYK